MIFFFFFFVFREEWQDLEAKKRAERVRKSIEIKQNKELHQLQLAEEKIKRDIVSHICNLSF